MDTTGAHGEAGWLSWGRLRRILGNVCLVIGGLLIIWTFVVWRWNDPVTSMYTRYEQHKLAAEYKRIQRSYRPVAVLATPRTQSSRASADAISTEARKFRAGAARGAPIGRIVVPRLGLNVLLVNGTDHDSLRRGPGRDERSFMPGQGELVYVAGHRTTYLAPFANIDKLRAGDRVTLEMPYGTFVYAVTRHEIVDAHDLAVLQTHHKEVLALQACHPRFFATHRYIAWAKPIRVIPASGRPTGDGAAVYDAARAVTRSLVAPARGVLLPRDR